MSWQPERYNRFEAERAAPFDDLLALITVRDGVRVLDLGCGSGELTARLADYLPGSTVLGIDAAPAMIAQAQRSARPGLRFECARIEDVAVGAAQWDVVFSHAALQWLPDHARLIPQVLGWVAPGGQFAAVIPSDHTIAARQMLRATAQAEPFGAALGGWTRTVDVLPLERYAELLFAHGAHDLTIFEKLYPVMLRDVAALVEWYRGTALIPYLERLPAALHAPFLAAFTARLREHFGDGPVLYPGKRIIIAARIR